METLTAVTETAESPGEPQTRDKNPVLNVTVARGSITDIKTPVVVVGGYKGIAPASALKALDDSLNQWISRVGDQGMIGSELGQVFFIPVMNKEIGAQSVLLAGMGDFGRFSYHDLRYLAMNICFSISGLRADSFATVLIGSGEGNLEVEQAVKGLMSGFCDALHRLDPKERVTKCTLVEYKKDRYDQILKIVQNLATNNVIENLKINVSEERVHARKGKKTQIHPILNRLQPVSEFVNRITIERNEGDYSFSALTNSAIIPVRKVEVQKFFTDGIAAELKAGKPETQQRFGMLLHKYIFPEDFERMLDEDDKPLTLVVDRDTAALPWEMACYGPPHLRRYFGPDLRLTRQFRTMLSRAPGISPPINQSLRALVIADPASHARLPGAKAEGEKVVELLRGAEARLKEEQQITLYVESCIGPEQCNPVKILDLLMNDTWDIVHYSGHGTFDAESPNNSGWVFNKVILSAREIFRSRQVPRVVFANACFSAAFNNNEEPTAEEANRKLAGLAEAFFERGVQNYIGTGWQVDDKGAQDFAQVFYEQSLKGESLGDALAAARRFIGKADSTWGAYQHYGQSNVRLV
jgi:hypothetical protein